MCKTQGDLIDICQGDDLINYAFLEDWFGPYNENFNYENLTDENN